MSREKLFQDYLHRIGCIEDDEPGVYIRGMREAYYDAIAHERARLESPEMVKVVAKKIALNLGWEWDNDLLKMGTDAIPSRKEFLGTAKAVIAAMKE